MTIYRTRGRIRQRVRTLAKLAGIEPPIVAFSRAEVLAHRPDMGDARRSMFTKRDDCYGRACHAIPAIDNCPTHPALIWFSMPVADSTLAHEVNHLRTRTSHNTQTFDRQVAAMVRGKAPTVKWHDYIVTVTVSTRYKVSAPSPAVAKQSYRRGEVLDTKQALTARKGAK